MPKNVIDGDADIRILEESFEGIESGGIDATRVKDPGELRKNNTTTQGLKRATAEAGLEGTCEVEEKLREAATPKNVAASTAHVSNKPPKKKTGRGEDT